MFQTPKIAAYIQKASLEGKEAEQLVRFLIYITPISHTLACEVAPAIADRIFKSDQSGVPQPIQEIECVEFDIGTVELQTMAMYPVADPAMENHGVLLKAVQISHIRAEKLFPDEPTFSLIFRAELPKDDLSFSMMGKYFKKKVFLTFETMQRSLSDAEDPLCDECEDPAVCADSENIFYCDKHKTSAIGEVRYIAKAQTPAEAAAEVDDRMDTSHINRRRKKKM